MGVTYAKRAWVFCFVILLLVPTTCSAETCVDLYKVYDKEYEISYPDNVIETIQNYNYAEKYLTMYYNIAKCEYNTEELIARRKSVKKELKAIESQLLSGYYLSLDNIRSLESEYLELKEKLSDIDKSLKVYEMDTDAVDAANVPTREQYSAAMDIKSDIDKQSNIGDIKNLERPFKSRSLLSSSDDSEVSYAVANNTEVTALFNGYVESVEGDKMTVSCYNGISVVYTGLATVFVPEGEAVKQYNTIARSSNTVTICLILNGNSVDVSKILK